MLNYTIIFPNKRNPCTPKELSFVSQDVKQHISNHLNRDVNELFMYYIVENYIPISVFIGTWVGNEFRVTISNPFTKNKYKLSIGELLKIIVEAIKNK